MVFHAPHQHIRTSQIRRRRALLTGRTLQCTCKHSSWGDNTMSLSFGDAPLQRQDQSTVPDLFLQTSRILLYALASCPTAGRLGLPYPRRKKGALLTDSQHLPQNPLVLVDPRRTRGGAGGGGDFGQLGQPQDLYSHQPTGRHPPHCGKCQTEDSGPAWGGGDEERS